MSVDDGVPSMRSSVSSSVSSSSYPSSGVGGNLMPDSRPISAPVASRQHPNNHSYTSRATSAPTTVNASVGGNSGDQNVRVVARVRPLSAKELGERSSESIVADAEQVTIRVVHPSEDVSSNGGGGGDKRKFEFDAVFGPSSTQAEVYENSCGDMISSSIFKGYNATILAYGQTGSGKTFTMGTDGSSTGSTDTKSGEGMESPSPTEGVIARAVYDLFQTKQSLPNGAERVKVTMSYLEIYNEQAIDLLNDDPASANATLQVRDSKDGVIIPNLKHFPVSSNLDVLTLMEKASLKRATGSTHMNLVSSRSHAICTLNVTITPDNDYLAEEGEEENDDGDISPRSATSLSSNNQGVRAKLTLVDLAGSERIKRTGAEGARMKEGININKGLFVLGQVVSALSELGQRNNGSSTLNQHSHIPYRDSKLTRLLQDSLGGNSRTVMIACISPAESNIEESINTLRYAERTRNIKNSAKINAVSDGSAASEAVALRRENQNLKLELARMESKLISSSNRLANVSTGFSFGGSIVSGNMDSGLQLQAQCSSLAAEIELLKGRAHGHAQEILEASLRADKWQAKSEAIALLAQEQGVDLSSLEEVASANDDLVSQLRGQLAERKAELLEARTEAMVARATAGAIIAAQGDISSIEHIDNSESSLNFSAFEDNMESQNEDLTTELTAVSATIQQKEAMVMQMNKERACMDSIHPHYENLLKQLMTEVDALTAERNDLMVKLSDGKDDGTKRKRKGNDPPMTKRLREQIGKLECRINELKVKANEHERSMKMKEEAEKKCARLLAEISEDKRRRAELQRKLKEASVEMRAEKKAAQQQASKLLKDSQQLKIELTKMKNVAQKQAAVLKRKIDQASAKEKARVELERKRRSAENLRLASSSNVTSQINEIRKIELSSWVDHEFEYSLIKFEINDQRRRLENAVTDRDKLIAISGDVVDVEELEEMDLAIGTLRNTVRDLETTANKAFPTAGDCNTTFRFLDTDKFKGLSKHDAAHVLSYIFDKCLLVKQELATILSNQEATTKTSIISELAKERQLHEREISKMKLEHSTSTVNLLQSTQDTINSHIKLSIDNSGVETELKEQLEGILGAYHASWSSATDVLKMHLRKLEKTQSDHEAMIENLTKGMAIAPMKFMTKKKKAAQHAYDSEAFESEESFMDEGDGEDSEYEPTPAKSKQKRRSPRLTSKKAIAPESPASPIGENFVDDIESMKVESLKKACKKLGVPVTGKKADLMQRVRNHILNTSVLNCSVASHHPAEDKKVNFECDLAVEPEFRPIDEKCDATKSIKKQLWCETDSRVSDETTQSSTKSLMPSKENISDEKENNFSMTPSKRARLLGFGSSSPRVLSPSNSRSTPVHLKQTIATSKKRLVPDAKQSLDVTKRSTNKRMKRGMNDAVARALEQCGDLL